MKYIVYLTTNKINNKIYIGVHKTENPDKFDGYLGCGIYTNKPSSYNKGQGHLHNAVLKYGVTSFYRLTLRIFDNLDDALDLEALLVNEEFVKRIDTYNTTIGGGMPPIMLKTIYQFDLKGILIKTWCSVNSIIEHYKCNTQRISMAIKDKRSFDNSYWSTEKMINVGDYRISYRGYVYQYNKDGILLNKFKNASEAALSLDMPRDAITNAVFTRTTRAGYYFLRAEEDINLLLYEKSAKKIISVTPVYKYDLNGLFLKEYKSIADAVKDNPKSSHSNIIRAIKNNKMCANFKWSYEKTDVLKSYNKINLSPVKIAQYDLNHNLIKIWDTVSACKKKYKSCQKVCRKERRSTQGFIFEYIS